MITSEAFQVLRVSAFSEAPVTTELTGLRIIEQVKRTGSMRRLVPLIAADKAFTVSPFDRLAVIERSGHAAKVVVVEGRSRGLSGWVPASWLHLDGRPDADTVALSAALADVVTVEAVAAKHAA